MFHRPTRTRRLATITVVSFALFMVVAVADVRSFWRWDGWISENGRWMTHLINGCAIYNSQSGGTISPAQHPQKGHLHAKVNPDSSALETGLWGFIAHSQSAHTRAGNVKVFLLRLPIWPLLLLFLIIPASWLFARPAGPAFPVVTDGGKETHGGTVRAIG